MLFFNKLSIVFILFVLCFGIVGCSMDDMPFIGKPARKHFNKATQYLTEGKLEDGIRELENTLAIDAEYPEAKSKLAESYVKFVETKNESLKEFMYKKSLKINRQNSDVLMKMSALNMARRDYKTAETYLNDVLGLKSEDYLANYRMGIVHLNLPLNRKAKDFKAKLAEYDTNAEKYFAKAVEVEKAGKFNANAYKQLAQIYWRKLTREKDKKKHPELFKKMTGFYISSIGANKADMSWRLRIVQELFNKKLTALNGLLIQIIRPILGVKDPAVRARFSFFYARILAERMKGQLPQAYKYYASIYKNRKAPIQHRRFAQQQMMRIKNILARQKKVSKKTFSKKGKESVKKSKSSKTSKKSKKTNKKRSLRRKRKR